MKTVTLQDRSSEIGRLLRKVREYTGRNQSEVASKAGISASMLSQIERGAVSPSIETLFAVCSALDFDIAELFRRLSPARPVRVVSKATRLRAVSGVGIRYEQLVSSVVPTHPAEMILLEVEAGRQIGISGRGHEGVEMGSVLEGRAKLTVDGKEYEIGDGDSVSFSSLLPHRLVNAGPGVFRAVWVVLPPHRDYLDQAEEPTGAGGR